MLFHHVAVAVSICISCWCYCCCCCCCWHMLQISLTYLLLLPLIVMCKACRGRVSWTSGMIMYFFDTYSVFSSIVAIGAVISGCL